MCIVRHTKTLCGRLCVPNVQVTALQIAALKRIGRGSKVLLLDRFGGASKAVAKELSRRGFGRVFVVSGGSRALKLLCGCAGWGWGFAG
jgi:rhodanese-related sulfurtransferase